jgi:hybrid cluster-associated redox disulfide protein
LKLWNPDILAMTKKSKISRDMTFAELLKVDPEAGMKLAERGLFCGGCPMAQFETIENGARAHGVDVDELIKELNSDE